MRIDRINYVIGRVKKAQEKELQEHLIEFLLENPRPSDEEVKEWADEKELDIHDVEAGMYELAAYTAIFLSGGRYNESGDEIDDDDPTVIAGMKIEMEHVNPDGDAEIVDFITRRISKDHLVEFDLYYDEKVGLPNMEKELEAVEEK